MVRNSAVAWQMKKNGQLIPTNHHEGVLPYRYET